MDKKAENKNDKPILPKANKIIVLVLAITFFVFSIFNVYLEIRKQLMCSQMLLFIARMSLATVQTPPSDIDSYILRKEAFENVCLERTGLGSYFWALASFWFLGYAIILFGKYPEKVQTVDQKT